MAKDPKAASHPDDERLDSLEAKFFSHDGETEEETRHRVSAPPPAAGSDSAGDAPPAAMRASPPGPPLHDDDPALAQRLASAAEASAQEHADDLADALHEKFMRLLEDRVRATDGRLTAEDVAEMGEEFRSQMGDIKSAFLEAVESFALARERGRIDQARGHLFNRLMVKTFEQDFTDERTLQDNPDRLSRRMLPGFFAMVSLMFGKPKLAEYERRVSGLVEKMRREADGELEWDDFYASPEARKISLRAEIEIAQKFQDPDKRMEWMIAVVNSNLIPLDESRFGTPWVFNEAAAQTLLKHLFADLRAALKYKPARATFAERLGEETVETLDGVVGRFR